MWGGIAMLLAAGVAATGSWSTPGERTQDRQSRARRGAGGVDRRNAADRARQLDRLAARIHRAARCRQRLSPGSPPPDGPPTLRSPDRGHPSQPAADPAARRWALGELAANSAWAGTLVYSGVLFTETYGTSSAATGVALAIVAVAYLAGNQWAGRTSPALARAMDDSGKRRSLRRRGAHLGLHPQPLDHARPLRRYTPRVTAARMVAGTVYGFTRRRRSRQRGRHRPRASRRSSAT